MSHGIVYDGDMTEPRFPAEDLERLVAGVEPESDELSRLAASLRVWQAEFSFSPSEAEILRVAARAAAIASEAPIPATEVTEKAARGLRWLRYKLATGLAVVLALSGMTGIAAAASDSAVPGDMLYGIDRALEAVGINDGDVVERIAEAQALFNRGEEADAVAHLADSLAEEAGGSSAADALLEVAKRLETTESTTNDVEVSAKVAEMLAWMADAKENAELSGREFGQEIAKKAKEIPEKSGSSNSATGNGQNKEKTNNGNGQGPDKEKPDGGNGNGPKDSPPGNSGNAPGRP